MLTKLDASLFVKVDNNMCFYVLIYVSDIIITGNDNVEIDKLVS